MNARLACRGLSCRRAVNGEAGERIVRSIDAAFAAGECCGISGSADSSPDLLLHLLGLLETPDAGEIFVEGISVLGRTPDEIQAIRNEKFGFLFQYSCLLPSFSVVENVAMPLFRICGEGTRGARARCMDILDFCGIAHLESTLANRLTPADRQAAALARALVHDPGILIALAPVEDGSLVELIRRAAVERDLCVLMAIQPESPTSVHRLLQMTQGHITNDLRL